MFEKNSQMTLCGGGNTEIPWDNLVDNSQLQNAIKIEYSPVIIKKVGRKITHNLVYLKNILYFVTKNFYLNANTFFKTDLSVKPLRLMA
jgi:hypothetical protein